MFSNYEFYKKEFHGNTITTEASFNYYGDRAAEYIEQATFGRATAENDKVKKCECRIAEILFANHDSGNEDEREVKSESVGGWSKTFAENKRTDEQLSAKIAATITQYLALTGLLYCGIRRRC